MGRYREKIGDIIKDEQKEEARIWWAIAGVAAAVLLFTLYHHSKALDLYFHAQRIEADYNKGDVNASYRDEDGNRYWTNVEGFLLYPKDGKITLYYTTDIAYAEPINSAWQWVFAYTAFGAALLVSVWRIYRIYHPRKHGD